METRANYILIGTFTLLASVGLMLFALWAANYSSEREWRVYRVIFHEPVTGLSEGSSVLYNGIAVGTVRQLMLDPNDPRAVIAELRLHASAPVKTDTSARLSMTSLTGTPVIQLTGGSPEAPLLVARGNAVPVIDTGASALQNIADTANRLVERLDRALSEDNVARISDTLSHLEQITRSVSEREDDIHALLANARQASQRLDAALTTTARTMEDFDRTLVQQLPALVARLDDTLERLNSAATGADQIIGDNRAAIASFASDGLAQLGPTLAELRVLAQDLRRISERFDENPVRYLFGHDAPKEFDPQ